MLERYARRRPELFDRLARYSFEGFGLMMLDPREARADGSVLVTRWLTVAFLPIAPAWTERVIIGPTERKGVPLIASAEKTEVRRLEKQPVDRTRSTRVYAFYYALLLPLMFIPLLSMFAYVISIDFDVSAGTFWLSAVLYLAWGIGLVHWEHRRMRPQA